MTPSARPPAKAMGIERRPLSATAASDPNTTRVKMVSLSGNSGPMSTPPRPASSIVMTQATADDCAVLTPRRVARLLRSTLARISRPTRVRRITNQSRNAAMAATTNTASWSLLRLTLGNPAHPRRNTCGGVGPTPGTVPPAAESCETSGRSVPISPFPTASTNHWAIAGSATRSPMVPMMRA